jgi:hypothetical protein
LLEVSAAASGCATLVIDALNRLVVSTSKSLWRFVAVTAIAVVAIRLLNRIGQGFPAAAHGAIPFDLQNGLTPADVVQQLAGYTDLARWMYYAFTMIDYVFPFAAGLSLAAAGTFALRKGFPALYRTFEQRKLFPLFLLGTAFDWCENVAAISAIWTYPGDVSTIATLLVIAKRLKLGFLIATQLAVLLLLIGAAFRSVSNRKRI